MQTKFLLSLISALLLSQGVLGSLRPRGHHHHHGNGNGNGGSTTTTTTTTIAAKTTTATTTTAASSSTSVATNNANNNNNNGGGGNSNPQTSLVLLQSLVQSASNNDGTGAGTNGSTTAGIVASQTSPNNFINSCAQSKLPLMNGVQIRTGACNPIPMGEIANFDTSPATKFFFPTNNANIDANTNFTAVINVNNFQVGVFTNADATYYAAPCAVNDAGQPIGHTHITIQEVSALDSTTPLPINKFAFFLGLKGEAVNGQVTGAVTGLPAGNYRISTIHSCGNHQALNGPIAQRGAYDDQVYFTVGGGSGSSGSTSSTSNQQSGSTSTSGSTGTTNNGTGSNNNGKGGKGNHQGRNGQVKRESLLAKRRLLVEDASDY